MSHQSTLIATDIDAYLAQHERKELLRFLTCGSVDDGKSTLIGRLLYDSKMIYEDQLAAVKKLDNSGATVSEFSALLDGRDPKVSDSALEAIAKRVFSPDEVEAAEAATVLTNLLQVTKDQAKTVRSPLESLDFFDLFFDNSLTRFLFLGDS